MKRSVFHFAVIYHTDLPYDTVEGASMFHGSNPLPDEIAAAGIDFARKHGISLVAFCKVSNISNNNIASMYERSVY